MTLVTRLTASLVPLVLSGVVLGALAALRGEVWPRFVPPSLGISITLFVGWVLLRGPWPGSGIEALVDAITLLFYVTLVVAALAYANCVQPLHSEAERAWFSFATLALAVMVFGHVATDQWVAKLLHNWLPILRSSGARNLVVDGNVVALNDSEINRQVVLLTLWAWPVWLMARNWRSPWSLLVSGALLVAVAIVVAYARSETAKLALAVGAVLYVLHWWRPWVGLVTALTGWTVAVFLVIPLSIAVHDLEMHKSERLFYTARARVVVWNSVAKKVLERPVVGHGLQSMRAHYYAEGSAGAREVDPETQLPTGAAHAHNVYLQVWYEFGGIGAALLGAFGYAVLLTLWRLPPQLRSVGLAHAGVIAGVMATGYGIWQPWLQAGTAYSIFLLLRAGVPHPVAR